jgi:hypothetical protein
MPVKKISFSPVCLFSEAASTGDCANEKKFDHIFIVNA